MLYIVYDLELYVEWSLKQDKIVWHYSTNGKFQVKKAYTILLNENLPSHLNSPTIPPKVWKTLWKVPLPQKILLFVWKVLHSALPVRNTLIHRGINCFDTCPFCQKDGESLDHLFLNCPFSRAVWLGSDLTSCIDTLPYHSISDWISNWIQGSQKENRFKKCIPNLFVTLWCIWNHRNGIVIEGNYPIQRRLC